MISSPLIEDKDFFTPDQLVELGRASLPQHIAVIMDGNRRWASREAPTALKDVFSGHWRGAEVVDTVVDSSLILGIKQLTLFAFSTENWKRSPFEIKQLMDVLLTFLKKRREKMKDSGICFTTIGDLTPFSDEVQREIALTKKVTEGGGNLTLVLALNYGGRGEICRASKAFAEDVLKGKINAQDLTESVFESYLDTSALTFSDPDLLIRTSGELRLSNFLLWQLAYTEVYVTETLWPDFSSHDLYLAIREFQKRERRLGK
jgi:undecaprenyl diphosphate synthase